MIDFTVEDHTPELFQKLEAAVSRFIKSSADAIPASAKGKMKESKSGRSYGSHRASALGESPASFSGAYTGSIEVVRASSLEAKVGAGVAYAPILENGINRPLWSKTLTEILPSLETRLAAEIAGL